MSFLETVSEEAAEGAVEEMYAAQRSDGHLPNWARMFSHRPEVMDAWGRLNGSIRSVMEPRRYELATMGAAVERRSTYCALAHGERLLGLGSSTHQVAALAGDISEAGLTEPEEAIVDFARKIAADAPSITQADIDRLRSLGLSDTDIFDLAAAAAVRLFFTSLCDATGTRPDAFFRRRVPDLVGPLTIGHPADPDA